jgi:PAS domain S-box-containing protein
MTEGGVNAKEARRTLYEVMDRNEPFETKAERVLELGVGYLDVDNGHIAKIDPQSNYWEEIVSTDPDDGQFPVGLVCDLENTYCRRTIRQNASLAIHDVSTEGWADDSAFETHGLHCYHGTVIQLNDETFGTVCFVSESAAEPFTESETMFAELIARLLEQELERQQYETELERQSNLSNVLNRVLRHNLRNSMAVIRGRTEYLADQCSEPIDIEPILEHADRLIDLGEKARSLESVIVDDQDRQEVILKTLLEQVVDTVQEEYPTASISVDCPEDNTIAVRPSLETALYELIENATKHTGASSHVTVSAIPVSDGFQIQITDNGPGLAETELKALTDGVETPLSHGTGLGLWLAYWVVTSHEGSIEATTTSDGTQVTIQLPQQARSTLDETNPMQTLQGVENRFRAVFEESSDAMLIANDDGRCVDANQAAGHLFGVPKQQLLGRSIDEFTPDHFDVDESMAEFQEAGSRRGTFELVRPDGTQRTVEYTAKSDIVSGQHLTILRDITERLARKQERQLAETVFENVQDAVFLLDVVDEQEFYMQRVNSAYEDLTKLSNDEIQGKSPAEIVGSERGAEIESRYRECVERRETIQYAETVSVEGKERHWETKLTPVIEDDTVVGLVGAKRDVTPSEQAQGEYAE